MKRRLFATGIFAVGFLASCGGGGSSPEPGEHRNVSGGDFVNVGGQISSGMSAQTLRASADGCHIQINGSTPAYVIAVTVDRNGNVAAAGSTVGPNCDFNLKLNKNFSYAFAIFDQNRTPLGVFTGDSGKVFKFLGDVQMNVVVENGQVRVSVSNPGNVQVIDDPNVSGAAENPHGYDKDGNGTPDFMEDRDGNGKMDCLEDKDGNGRPDTIEDEDMDDIPDYVEDRDFDGRPERHECDREDRFDDEEGMEREESYECPMPPEGDNQGSGRAGR